MQTRALPAQRICGNQWRPPIELSGPDSAGSSSPDPGGGRTFSTSLALLLLRPCAARGYERNLPAIGFHLLVANHAAVRRTVRQSAWRPCYRFNFGETRGWAERGNSSSDTLGES